MKKHWLGGDQRSVNSAGQLQQFGTCSIALKGNAGLTAKGSRGGGKAARRPTKGVFRFAVNLGSVHAPHFARNRRFSEEYKMRLESSRSSERPSHPVQLGSVLSLVSLALTIMAWFYAPGHLFYYVAAFVRPLFAQYTRAACGSTIPLAAIAFGLWAVSFGRRACGTAWFVIALVSVLVSGNLVAANFYVSSALPQVNPTFVLRH